MVGSREVVAEVLGNHPVEVSRRLSGEVFDSLYSFANALPSLADHRRVASFSAFLKIFVTRLMHLAICGLKDGQTQALKGSRR